MIINEERNEVERRTSAMFVCSMGYEPLKLGTWHILCLCGWHSPCLTSSWRRGLGFEGLRLGLGCEAGPTKCHSDVFFSQNDIVQRQRQCITNRHSARPLRRSSPNEWNNGIPNGETARRDRLARSDNAIFSNFVIQQLYKTGGNPEFFRTTL